MSLNVDHGATYLCSLGEELTYVLDAEPGDEVVVEHGEGVASTVRRATRCRDYANDDYAPIATAVVEVVLKSVGNHPIFIGHHRNGEVVERVCFTLTTRAEVASPEFLLHRLAKVIAAAGGHLSLWATLQEDEYETIFGDGLYLHLVALADSEAEAAAAAEAITAKSERASAAHAILHSGQTKLRFLGSAHRFDLALDAAGNPVGDPAWGRHIEVSLLALASAVFAHTDSKDF